MLEPPCEGGWELADIVEAVMASPSRDFIKRLLSWECAVCSLALPRNKVPDRGFSWPSAKPGPAPPRPPISSASGCSVLRVTCPPPRPEQFQPGLYEGKFTLQTRSFPLALVSLPL